MKRLALVALGFVATAWFGCATSVHLRSIDLEGDELPSYQVSAPIALVNQQPKTGPIVLAMLDDGYSYVFDPNEWTDTAIAILATELRGKGMPEGAAQKELHVSVVRAEGFSGRFAKRCTVFITLQAGETEARPFEGQAGSGRGMIRACEGGLTRALASAISDPAIQAFLR